MLRVLILTALICVYCGMLPSVAAKTLLVNKPSTIQISSSDTTSATNANATPSITTDEVIDSNNSEQQRYYHPTEYKKPHVIEEFNRQFLDGSYEYKYILSNGVARYEKSYWKLLGNGKKLLARKGFYSHPLPNYKYLTVFYTADEHGYLQDVAKYTNAIPTLPKHLDVSQLEFPHGTNTISTTTTTRKPKTTTLVQRPVAKPSQFNWIY